MSYISSPSSAPYFPNWLMSKFKENVDVYFSTVVCNLLRLTQITPATPQTLAPYSLQ
jgi:hypothetical protein